MINIPSSGELVKQSLSVEQLDLDFLVETVVLDMQRKAFFGSRECLVVISGPKVSLADSLTSILEEKGYTVEKVVTFEDKRLLRISW